MVADPSGKESNVFAAGGPWWQRKCTES